MSYFRNAAASRGDDDDSDDASPSKRNDSGSEDAEDKDDFNYKNKGSDPSDPDDPSDYSDTAHAMSPPFRPPQVRQRGLSSHSESSSYYMPNEPDEHPARIQFRGSSSQSDDGTNANVNDSLELSSQSESEDQQNSMNVKRKYGLGNSGNRSKRHRGPSVLSNSTSADSDREDDPPALPDRSIGRQLLEKMGYQDGMGLGKHAQGMKEPITASKQRGKRGLGFKIEGLITQGEKFKPEMEEISVKEHVTWLNGSQDCLSWDQLRRGIVIGPRKLQIDDETLFCDSIVLQNILLSKSVFDKLEGMELSKARSRANPFEAIKGVFFLNRAAMKMANLDAVLDFMFTNPKDRDGNVLVDDKKLLYFADVCAGPGGFSEYVLWRKKWRAKGIGFTLKGQNDFKLDNFFAAPCETFDPYYGVNGDGNVFDPDNIDSLYKHVMLVTEEGVHFMMADGGFSVDGQENIQEILSKRLYLCQCLVALRIVRPGGHFVVKLFDLFTPFSVGLIYLMHTCFDRIALHKPNTSRPANSERYLICEFKRDEDWCAPVISYLTKVNIKLGQLEKGDQDVNELVPNDVLTAEDSEFFKYITNSNNILGERQCVSLLKIAAYSEDPALNEIRQNQIRKECLQLYGIEEKTRMAPALLPPASLLADFWDKTPIEKIEKQEMVAGSAAHVLQPTANWKFCVVGSRKEDDVAQPTLFYGQGGLKVLRLEGKNQWLPIPSRAQIELPRDTLILGELIPEYEGERANQKNVVTLHILDAVRLAGEDVKSKPFEERLQLCELFAKALRRSNNLVFHKLFLPLVHVSDIFESLEVRSHKNGNPCRALPVTSVKFLKPGGMLCMPCNRYPWVKSYSRTHRRDYYFNTKTNASLFEIPKEAIADSYFSLTNMKIWWWDEGVRLKCDHFSPDLKKLQPKEILDHIQRTA